VNVEQAPLPRLTAKQEGWIPASAYCPVSLGTRLIGDRWSLLIVREILVGASRFNATHGGLQLFGCSAYEVSLLCL
jgi:hypothetical protein